MFFEISNSPVPPKRKKGSSVENDDVDDEVVLKLAPFSGTPTVTFENVPVNVEAKRYLKILNPKPEGLQVSVSKRPDELGIALSWYEIYIEPLEVATLVLSWCPKKPIAQRLTMQISEKRSKYDVFVVCKCVNKKNNQKTTKNKSKPIGFKRSPVRSVTKNIIKTNVILETIKKKEFSETVTFKKKVVTDNSYLNCVSFSNASVLSNLTQNENDLNNRRDTYLISDNGPLGVEDFPKENVLYEQTPKGASKFVKNRPYPDFRILSPIENMQFSPLKAHNNFKKNVDNHHFFEEKQQFSRMYNDQFNKNSYMDRIDFDISPLVTYSLSNSKQKTEGIHFETFNIDDDFKSLEKNITPIIDRVNKNYKIDITGIDDISPFIKHPFPNSRQQNENFSIETYNVNSNYESIERKMSVNHINLDTTHSIIEIADDSNVSKTEQSNSNEFLIPKSTKLTNLENQIDIHTPINKIHDQLDNCSLYFNPKRCSTEKKSLGNSSDKDLSIGNFICSETFTKGDSPIIPLNPEKDNHLHSSPYSIDPIDDSVESTDKLFCPKTLFSDNVQNFNERYNLRNSIKEKNDSSSAKSVIEAGLWTKSPPSNPVQLQTIPEEPSIVFSEVSSFDTNKKFHSETFILDRTYETKTNNTTKQNENVAGRKKWNKTAVKRDPVFHKVLHKDTIKTKEMNTRVFEESCHTLDVYTIATTIDPFLAATSFYDEEAFNRLESEFKHWLNYLLTPPSDFDTKLDVDVGKVWIENRNKNVPVAPTKEQVSAKYHTTHRLESLRKTAKALIKSSHITAVFLKVTSQIERKLLSIRTDKNLHLDIGLQKYVLSLLLCYNPLWLRIGLEALYDKTIPLASNDDFGGLSDFITHNMFRDPYVSDKHLLIQLSYAENLKKFTLKKFLFLVYFLDQAKKNKIIFHDPCLFCRNAPFKESRQILFQFAKELLSGVGDITKHLKPTGYIVSHEQSRLNEFKYAVHNLATDLKDGIRLVRLMEIILLKENLTSGLRMPAISRFQKIHNVQIALTALASTDFKIVGDITARDIVDGHREKTLSLLWQLIHKFRAPLFEKASITIQKWWKRKYLKISIEKRIEERKIQKLHVAAFTIQSWWRKIQYRKQYLLKLSNETKASVIIQKNWRMWIFKSYYNKLKESTMIIQEKYWNHLLVRKAKIHLKYLRENRAATVIQQWYRKMKIRNMLKSQNIDRKNYLQLKSSVLKIQNLFRANMIMKKEQKVYIKLKISTVKIQRFYRSVIKTRIIRKQFLILKASAIVIQNRHRANMEMRKCKENYETTKTAALKIQNYYRNYVTMKKCRNNFIKTQNATVNIQRFYRNYLLMKKLHNIYLTEKKSAIIIQRYYRSYVEMKKIKNRYALKKLAAIKIQRKFRSYVLMKRQRESFLTLKEAVITIQRYYRAKKLMENVKLQYDYMKYSAIIIQRYYKSYVLTKLVRREYLQKKQLVICMQRKFRYNKIIKERHHMKKVSDSAIKIQIWLKSIWLMRKVRKEYLMLRETVIRVQILYKNKILMERERQSYKNLKNACIFVQRYYRAKKETQMLRCKFLQTKQTVVVLQNRYRAYRSMKLEREKYLTLKKNVLFVQMMYRNKKLTQETQLKFRNLQSACVLIQRKYRTLKLMKTTRENYLNCKRSAIIIQNYYKSFVLMKSLRNRFLILKQSAIIIQRFYRAYILKKQNRNDFLKILQATIKIQRFYRANKTMQSTKVEYLEMKNATIAIQRFYRNYKITCTHRSTYLNLVKSVKFIQDKYRAKLLAREIRNEFVLQKNSAITIQRVFRSYLLMKMQRKQYLDLLKYSLIVQRRFREKLLTESLKKNFVTIRISTIKIQSYYRMYICRKKYLKMINATITIQRFYRNHKITRMHQSEYLNVIKSVKFLQDKYRAKLLARKIRNDYLLQKNSAITIQRVFKSYLLTKMQRKQYLDLLKYSLIVQRRFREKLLTESMKKNFVTIRISTIKIQSYYRMYICRKKYLEMINATITIQRFYRNYKITRMHQSEYLNVIKSVKFLQDKYRAKLLARKTRNDYLLQKNSAITIQRVFRSYLLMKMQRKQYLDLLNYSLIIQRRFREKLLTDRLKKNFVNIRISIIKIQSYYRMYICRKKYLEMKNSALTIQNYYRAYALMKKDYIEYRSTLSKIVIIQKTVRKWLVYRRYIILCNSIIQIQRNYRKHLESKENKRQNAAAVKIQSLWRAYTIHKKYIDLKHSVIYCQTRRRAIVEMRQTKETYQRLYKRIVRLQAVVRGYLCRQNIKAKKLNIESISALRLRIKSIIKIQAYWRGYNVRKEQGENSSVKKLRRRWQKGALQSSQLTIAERNSDALDVLCHFNDIASVIRAFKTLDFVTSVYPMLYSTDETAGAISKRLILYMGASNRSVSTLETLQLGVAVLINLTRYTPTAHFVYSIDTVNTIITLMMRWCGKDNYLSRLFCTLLWLFGKYENIKIDLSSFLQNPNSYKILCKVRSAIIREKRMSSNKRHSQTPVKSFKLDQSFAKNTTISNINNMTLPMTEPDFGIIRTSKPKIFQDEVHAINSVFNKYGLPLNNFQ